MPLLRLERNFIFPPEPERILDILEQLQKFPTFLSALKRNNRVTTQLQEEPKFSSSP